MDANTSPGAPQPPSPPVIPAAEGAPAAEPIKTADSPEEMAATIAALKAELDALRAENAALKASTESMGESAKALAETRRQVTQLSERVAKAEAAASDEKLARELDGYEARGLFAPASRSYFAELAKTSRKLFAEGIARLEKNPEVPLGQVGHSARVEPPASATADFQARVSLLLSEGKAASKVEAINAVKAADPALYARAIRE